MSTTADSTATTPSRNSRALGALLGVHAGDSLGATLEFRSYSSIKSEYPSGLKEIVGGGTFNWPPGHATDDTDLTRAVLLAYAERARRQKETGTGKEGTTTTTAATSDVVTAAAENMLKWYEGDWPERKLGQGPKDIGGATSTGLENYEHTRNPLTSGAGHGSAGNGSLMRCIPTALFQSDKQLRVSESIAISAVTHNDRRCTVSCAVYNEMVAGLLDGRGVGDVVREAEELAGELGSPAVKAAITAGQGLDLKAYAAKSITWKKDYTSGYVLNALTLAVAALRDERGFEKIVVDVVRLGGDTDTNGAIVGGAVGARDGVERIPERWTDMLQFGKEFKSIVEELSKD
jgi:ADP-ribosylglycohydrolase